MGSEAAFKLLATCENLKKSKLHVDNETMWYSEPSDHLLGAPGVSQHVKIRGLETVKVFDETDFLTDKKVSGKTVGKALLQVRKAIKEKKRAAKPRKLPGARTSPQGRSIPLKMVKL